MEEMERVLLLLIVTLVMTAANMLMAARLPYRLNGGVRDAIDEAIRRQDERIQKRLERMRGDTAPTSDRQPEIPTMQSGDWIPDEIWKQIGGGQ